jgi:hypothetical protein
LPNSFIFRQEVYNRLGAAHDATFELTDAVLLTRNAYSLADLSLSPVFRRKWPSIYQGTVRLLWVRVTARLLGYQKPLVVGLYPWF